MDFLLKATLIFLNRHDLFYQVLRRIFSTYGIHPVYSDGLCANQLLSDMAQHGHIAQRLRVVLKKKGFSTRDTGFSAVCLVPQNIDMRPSLRDVVIIYWFNPPPTFWYMPTGGRAIHETAAVVCGQWQKCPSIEDASFDEWRYEFVWWAAGEQWRIPRCGSNTTWVYLLFDLPF